MRSTLVVAGERARSGRVGCWHRRLPSGPGLLLQKHLRNYWKMSTPRPQPQRDWQEPWSPFHQNCSGGSHGLASLHCAFTLASPSTP